MPGARPRAWIGQPLHDTFGAAIEGETMADVDQPWRDPEIQKLSEAVASSYLRLLGAPLLGEDERAADRPPERLTAEELAEELYFSRCALLCHDASTDPRFTYANRAAQELFARSWKEFIGLPSRLSAEPDNRELRAKMLSEVATAGFIRGYAGVRIAATGRRFAIEDASVWNVTTADGEPYGQAARICQWRILAANDA